MKKWLITLFLLISLCGCDNTTKIYSNYSDISDDDSIKSWLPDFFPKKSNDIRFTSNLDLNSFSVYFSIPKDESLNVPDKKPASSQGIRFIKERNKDVNSAVCVNASYNLFNDRVNNHFLIGPLNSHGRYYLVSITDKQHSKFCQ